MGGASSVCAALPLAAEALPEEPAVPPMKLSKMKYDKRLLRISSTFVQSNTDDIKIKLGLNKRNY